MATDSIIRRLRNMIFNLHMMKMCLVILVSLISRLDVLCHKKCVQKANASTATVDFSDLECETSLVVVVCIRVVALL